MGLPLLVIGGGNMGKAILRGGLGNGVLPPDSVFIVEPDASKHEEFRGLGVKCSEDLAEGAAWLRAQGEAQVLLAIKPQMLEMVAQSWTMCGMREWAGVVITILAGMPGARVHAALGPRARVVRAMPNLPAAIGEGATAICASEGAVSRDVEFASKLFAGIGPVVVHTREELMDAFTAAAGSGPAYVFLLAEAMQATAVRHGFDAESARALVIQTIKGAALMMDQSGESAAVLRARVTSKGGTTEAALAAMSAAGFAEAIGKGMDAALARARELGQTQK
jgi:pyrroline-5-carboxylate reductase